MDVASIARRLADGNFHYALGRFETVRRGYSLMRGLVQPPRRVSSVHGRGSLFRGTSAEMTLRSLQRDSVAFGFNLPATVVHELVRFAREALLHDRGVLHPFTAADVEGGRLPDGTPVVQGIVPAPMSSAAVRRVSRDPVLVETMARFLGYQPARVESRLFWSFASPVDEEERRRHGQVIDWHFDVHGYNFVTANFYLTDVDHRAGPRVILRGSHHGKRLGMLWGSANASEREVFDRFGEDRQLIVEGPAGTGFIEDTSCYHRVMPPKDRDQLMMQISYS